MSVAIDLRYLRIGTAADLAAQNPVLPLNYPALEVDTGFIKIGNGVSAYTTLGYITDTPVADAAGSTALALIQTYPSPAQLQDLSAGKTNQLDPTQVKGATGYASLGAQLTAMQTQINNLGAGGGGGSAPTVTQPTIAGTKTVGSTLTATPGTVTTSGGHASSSSYQWNREGPLPRAPISLATGLTYILAAADLNYFISFTQTPLDTVTNSPGAPATSVLTAIITGTTPSNSVAPSISPSGSQASGVVLTLAAGTWANAATFGYQFYDNGVPIGTRGSTATYTPGATQIGHVITGDVIGASSLGVSSAAVAASNSVTVTGVAQTILNTAVPTLSGTVAGGGIGIVQAKAVDTNGAAVSLNNVLPQTAAANFRMELIALTSKSNASVTVVASPGAVSWSQFAVTDGTGGGFPNAIQAWHPAAYTNLDTSVLSSFPSQNAIKFDFESDIIDGSFGLLAGIIGESPTNPGLVWASPAITGLTGDLVLIECVYTGGGASEGLNNGGDSTRLALSGTGITAGHRGNAADGDDMYVQYRTIIGATAGQSFTGAGGFIGNGGGLQGYSAMILAFRKKAGGAGNNIVKGQTYNIVSGAWTSNGVATVPTSRAEDFYVNGVLPAGYSTAGSTYTADATVAVGQIVKLVERAVIGSQTYTSSLTGATAYTVIAAAAALAVTLQSPPVLVVTAGAAISPFPPAIFSGGTTPYTITVNPALPSGLSLNASTGVVSGTTSAIGSLNYVFTGTDAVGASVSSAAFNIAVQSAQSIPIFARMAATTPFAQMVGTTQLGGALYGNLSSLSDAIDGGLRYPATLPSGAAFTAQAVNGSTQRIGKQLDPLGGGFTVFRHAIHPSDPLFEGSTASIRADTSLPGSINDGDTVWSACDLLVPASVFNNAGTHIVLFELHGGVDGNGFYVVASGIEGSDHRLMFQAVRSSAGDYTTYGLGNASPVAGDVYLKIVVRQTYGSALSGAATARTTLGTVSVTGTNGAKAGTTARTQVWINGTLMVDSNEVNWLVAQGNGSYPKTACYNGDVPVPTGGSWWNYRDAFWVLDNSKQYTEPQIRALLL